MLTHHDFFDLEGFPYRTVFADDEWVWQTLSRLEPWLDSFFREHAARRGGDIATSAVLEGDVYVEDGACIEDHVVIRGPAIIGAGAEIRQGALLRDYCIVGPGAELGHAGEMKHSILLNEAKAPHFAYIGDSILGAGTNLGAGTKLSNLPVSSAKDASGLRPTIALQIDGEPIDTGLAKLGAIIGDRSQIGCNSVTNPGTLIGKDTLIYPNVSVAKGYYAANSIVKLRQQLEVVARR